MKNVICVSSAINSDKPAVDLGVGTARTEA